MLASAGDYRTWIKLGDVVDVDIESVTLFKFDLPLQRYSSIRNRVRVLFPSRTLKGTYLPAHSKTSSRNSSNLRK
ncbi:hypothetical protein KCU92_g98, partial [Aureobasidium melanogenum]